MSQAEIVALGSQRGIVVAEALTDAHGQAVFRRHGAVIEAQLWKATGPDVPLVGARVCLLARLEGGLPTDAHALLADDPYWGRRIGPAQFRTGSLAQQIVLGYRLQGRIRQDGEPIAGANVSLEGELHDAVHGPALFWDSLEYNRLIWSDRLETWIEGAVVDAPIRTDAQGRFELIVPCGHGAIYQRATDLRDGCPETAAEPLPRHLHRLQAAYLGRKVELIEGQVAELELLSGALQIAATAGALLRVGTLDAPGATYTVPSGGTVSLTGLPAGEHSIVQFRRTGGGLWDDRYGCPRRLVTIAPGQAAQITMPALEQYSPGADLVAGRVYLRMGLPAAGVDIVAINWERCEVVGTVATTDAEGYWEAQFPPAGFGGDLWIHDPVHGSMPVIGFPYSDVVLGARAYASHLEQWKPEAWRREDRGHKNFQYIPGAIVIQDRGSGQRYGTIEAAYGGWQTEQALMKFSYVEDLEELLVIGTRERSYRIMHGEQVLLEEFALTAQPFESYDTISGRYRAAGFHPQKKYLLGGRISGTSVLAPASCAPQDHISAEYPEALRTGLEFGDHAPYLAIRHHSPQIAQETMSAPAQPQIAPGMECTPYGSTSASSDFPTRTPAESCDGTCRTHDCTPAECATCAVPGGTCPTGRTDPAHAAHASETRSVRHTESGPAQSAPTSASSPSPAPCSSGDPCGCTDAVPASSPRGVEYTSSGPTSASSDLPTRTPVQSGDSPCQCDDCTPVQSGDSTCETHDCTSTQCATCAVPGGTCPTGRTDPAHAAPASETRSVRHTESGPAQSASASSPSPAPCSSGDPCGCTDTVPASSPRGVEYTSSDPTSSGLPTRTPAESYDGTCAAIDCTPAESGDSPCQCADCTPAECATCAVPGGTCRTGRTDPAHAAPASEMRSVRHIESGPAQSAPASSPSPAPCSSGDPCGCTDTVPTSPPRGVECAPSGPTSASPDLPTRTPVQNCDGTCAAIDCTPAESGDSTCETHDCTSTQCATCAVPGGTCRTGRTDPAHAAPASEARSVRHTESGPAQSAPAAATLAIADWICPYCGGPAYRDPDSAAYRRGFCIQCADCFGDAGAMDCRTWHLSPTLAPAGGYRMAAELLRTDGTALRRQVQYHWRPELYQESEEFLTQQGLGQPTNAPRWVARHVTEIGDGLGFGRFDAAAEPPFTPGHDTQYFAALPQIERPLGLTQVKIVLPQGYSLPETVELEVDCERADGQIETVPVRLQAGLRGPTEDDPLGDVVLLRPTAKLTAEALPWPYIGSGLYRGVAAVRVVSEPAPDSCRFALVNDNPWLADAAGVPVAPQMRTPTALQLAAESGPGVELFDDAVGRIYLLHCDGSGRLWLTRRDGLAAPWQAPLAVTGSGSDGPPAADKTDAGIMVVYDQHAGSLRRLTSRDDGEKWT